MRVRSAIILTALLGTVLPLVHSTAAYAGDPFTIAVDDPTVKLKESFTVTGSDACASSPYEVSFVYTTHDGGQATLTLEGTTTDTGTLSQVVTVPEAATPDQPASVQATVTCAPPQGAARQGGQITQTSNTVDITIEVATGVLSTDKTQGRAGTVVAVSGTNCLGDDVVVVFGDDTGAARVNVTLRPDDTFSGSYTIPNVPPGQYFFAASCPGTDYADRGFVVLVTPGVTPAPLPPAPPPTPVPGPVRYAG